MLGQAVWPSRCDLSITEIQETSIQTLLLEPIRECYLELLWGVLKRVSDRLAWPCQLEDGGVASVFVSWWLTLKTLLLPLPVGSHSPCKVSFLSLISVKPRYLLWVFCPVLCSGEEPGIARRVPSTLEPVPPPPLA